MDGNDILGELRDAPEQADLPYLETEKLALLSASDIPDGVSVRIDQLTRECLDTRVFVLDGKLQVAVDYSFVRQWRHPALNLNYDADLLRRAVELRELRFGDVYLQHFVDDEEHICLYLSSQEKFTVNSVPKPFIKDRISSSSSPRWYGVAAMASGISDCY